MARGPGPVAPETVTEPPWRSSARATSAGSSTSAMTAPTSTTGTGTITLGSAFDGFQTFADGGISDGNVVRYTIIDGTAFEIGTETYTHTGTTLSRTLTESSSPIVIKTFYLFYNDVVPAWISWVNDQNVNALLQSFQRS